MTEKPQVYVNVSGGIAEATVTRGDVDVIQIDWDNVNDESDIDTLREYRSELEQVADEEYRTRLLADMDEVIEKAIAEEEDAEIREEERRQHELAKARDLLRAAGELP